MKIEYYLNEKKIIKSLEPLKQISLDREYNVEALFNNLYDFHIRCMGIKSIGNSIPNRTSKKIITNNMIYNKFIHTYNNIYKKVIHINHKKNNEENFIKFIGDLCKKNIVDIENTGLREISKRSIMYKEVVLGKSYPQIVRTNVDNFSTLMVSDFDRVSYNFREFDLANLFKTLLCIYPQKAVDKYIENVDKYKLSGENSIELIKKLVYFPERTLKVVMGQYNTHGKIVFNDKLERALKKDGILEISRSIYE